MTALTWVQSEDGQSLTALTDTREYRISMAYGGDYQLYIYVRYDSNGEFQRGSLMETYFHPKLWGVKGLATRYHKRQKVKYS